MARTPVTRGQYQLFLEATGHGPPEFWDEPAFVGASRPAVGPSWDDANLYCQWLTESLGDAPRANGTTVRLPTEAEWEYAAKAGRKVLYPWGDEPPETLPDYERRWLNGPEPVDAYPSRHPWGFLGLGENVHEWCSDWYDAGYYAVAPEHDPRGPDTGRRRASRGGAWRHAIKVSRCAARSSIPPGMRYRDYGFRIAAAALKIVTRR